MLVEWEPERPPGSPLRGSPPSRRPACLRLDVGRVFLVFILIEEAGAVAAALTLGAALDPAAGSMVDLHQKGLIPIKPEGQELPFGQAVGACERFSPLAQEYGVIRRVLCQNPGGAIGAVMSTNASTLADSVGPPSAEVCRTAASFPYVNHPRFIELGEVEVKDIPLKQPCS